MGHESEDAFAIQMQDILVIANSLKEATAVSNSLRSHSTTGTSSPVVVDSIKLPSPRPLLPTLLEAGISSEVASAASQIYQRRAEQFKQRIQDSITAACRTAAEFPAHTSASPCELFMKRVTSIFTDVYFSRLKEWNEEIIQRIKQASETPIKAASRNSRTFNQEYVPLLEHFFKENPFPTHADKMFLAKKSNMQYRQIHVWFQNRRNRTKREVKPLRKKPINEGAAQQLDGLYECMKGYMVDSVPQAPKLSQAEETTGTEAVQNNAFASSAPPHAFPSSYPPTCHYDPFPCKSGPVYFSKPEWRHVPHEQPLLSPSTSVNDLVERFSNLNVRDGTQSGGSPKLQSHAATVAITVIPSRAPHPSLIARKYNQPTNIVQLHSSVHATVSRSKGFQSPSPTSKPLTLIPLSIPPNKSELPGKRKIASLPQCFPGRKQNSRRDITPSEISSTPSSSPRLFSTDSENRSCSLPSVSSLSTPSDVASIQGLPHLSGSPCRSPFHSPVHLHGSGDMVTISSSVS